MSIKITAVITVKPECRQELQEVFQALIPASRREAGNIRYDLHQDLQNENRFVFFENWRDQAAVDEHNASAHFQAFVDAIEGKTDVLDIIVMRDVSENSD
ncbi:antibiotic biosynthesis monooxygenase [Neisseria chenwenguii]|uniref:Antibiotic biosynthesis monooxygenase n=1 Tax=Neisseria chenwenguii TaxID=1853278 RepID=A0A220S363_9NEIS|nr:putative quinol monooxygenase [Neisseria chenwenguii]ASK27882.1 antibiotic biosynthesis monooxygenase [Neisseria chenwenguii]